MTADDYLVKQLRSRACPAGLDYTGDNPKEDHGHTDCWLYHQAADRIEELTNLIAEWIGIIDDDNPGLSMNEWDSRYDAAVEALRQAVGR